MTKKAPVKDPMNRTALYAELAESTGISKKDVAKVIDELGNVISRHINKKFTLS